jgi:hypothetical protein
VGSVTSRKAFQFIEATKIFGYNVSGFVLISNVAERMGDLTGDNGKYIMPEVVDRDAVRHFTWMYSTSTFYGTSKAWQIGDVHERLGAGSEELFKLYKAGTNQDLSYVKDPNKAALADDLILNRPSNMSIKQFKELVATIMDYQNNKIAINAARNFSGKASGREGAEAAIEYFHDNGLTSFKMSKDGNTGTVLANHKISDAEYYAFKKELRTLDHSGYRKSSNSQKDNKPDKPFFAGNFTPEKSYQKLATAALAIAPQLRPLKVDVVNNLEHLNIMVAVKAITVGLDAQEILKQSPTYLASEPIAGKLWVNNIIMSAQEALAQPSLASSESQKIFLAYADTKNKTQLIQQDGFGKFSAAVMQNASQLHLFGLDVLHNSKHLHVAIAAVAISMDQDPKEILQQSPLYKELALEERETLLNHWIRSAHSALESSPISTTKDYQSVGGFER